MGSNFNLEESTEKLKALINNIKPIAFLPNTTYMTTEMVGEYFGVSPKVIRNMISKRREEFLNSGLKILFEKELKQFKEMTEIKKLGTKNLTLVPFYCFIKITSFLTLNELACKIMSGIYKSGLERILVEIKSNIVATSTKVKTIIKKERNYLIKQKKLEEILKIVLTNIADIKREVWIGRYRVDILINNRVIVECDEYGHANYSQDKERERETFLTSKGYIVIRFNPDDEGSCIFDLINKIIMEINNKNITGILLHRQILEL